MTTLATDILAYLSETQPTSSDAILIRFRTSRAAAVLGAMVALVNAGLVVHTFVRSQSHFRKLTAREVAKSTAVKTGKQGELL